jgi:phage tail sheath gpL-like
MIQFNEIPGNLRVPLWYAEFNAAQAPFQSISRLLLVGQRLSGAVSSAAKSGGNTGDGALTLAGTPRLPGAKQGVYQIRLTTVASGGGTFTVTDPLGNTDGTYVVGASAFATDIAFTIADGTPDFALGDGFDVTVQPYGSATAEQPIQVTGGEDGLFGYGSMLASMYKTARRNAPFQEIWCLPIDDDDAGVKATGKFTIGNAPPLSSGTLSVYIADQRIRIAVSTADSNATIAARLVAEINATPHMPVVASVTNTVECTLTARHAGAQGNYIRLHGDYHGDEGPLFGEIVTVTAMTGGSGDPELNSAFANLGDEEYDFIAAPYCDTTNLGYVNALLNNSSGRWSPISQLYGGYFAAKDDTSAALGTFGNTKNDPHVSIMGYYRSPSAPWTWAAAYGAIAAAHLQVAPELSRPLHTLILQGVWAPKLVGDRFTKTQRQALYYDGIASYHVRRSGEVCIDRACTTYQLNPWGIPDPSWLDVETQYQGMFAIRYLRAKVVGQWGRAALRDENPHGVQGVATPSDVRNTVIHGYRELSALNVVENEDLFESLLIVERNMTDANRLDIFLPLDHVNQLRIIAVNATSFLNFEVPIDSAAA